MKKSISVILIISMLLSVVPVFAENMDESASNDIAAEKLKISELPAANGIIIKAKENVPVSAVAQSLRAGRSLMAAIPAENDSGIALLSVSEEEIPEILEQLNKNENVEYAQPNYRVALSEIDINQWGLQNAGQSVNTAQGVEGYDINVLDAWGITQGSEDVVVGILDTGIDLNHEALANKIWVNPNDRQDNTDNDGNGYTDDVHGWDFVNGDNTIFDSPVSDEHGTHIAGIISSVAPNVKLLPLKAFSYNAGYTYDIVNAIHYAKSLGVKIINCSFAGTENNTALMDAMSESDMLFVCAAGNYARSTDELITFPACYGFENILSVAAIDSTGMLSPISTYGEKIDIAAPGINIYSTLPNNEYGFKDGTSMAAAYASGAAALILSGAPELPAAQIRRALVNSAVKPAIMPGNSSEAENLLDVTGALKYEFPPEKQTNIPSILGAKADSESTAKGERDPFTFELQNDILSFVVHNNNEYQIVSVDVREKKDDTTGAILIADTLDAPSSGAVVPGWETGVDYIFTVKFNNGGMIDNYIGDLKLFYADEVNENVVNYFVAFHNTYATAEYIGGDFELMAQQPEGEPNNTRGTATQIFDDNDVSGKISPSGDNDWFRISFPKEGFANFWVGNIPIGKNYDLEIYDTLTGGWIERSRNPAATSSLDEELVHMSVSAGIIYYIRVYGATAADYSTAEYMLRVKWYSDGFEPNNTFADAAQLKLNSANFANINPLYDVDFYKFTTTTVTRVNVLLTNLPSGTDYDMKIYNAPSESYVVETSANGGTTDESFSILFGAGTFYIKVYAWTGSSDKDYTLKLTSGTSYTLEPNATYWDPMTALRNVFYSYSPTVDTGLKIEVYGFSGDLDLFLYKKNTSTGVYEEIAEAYTGNPTEIISKSLTPGDYLLLVNDFKGDSTAFYIRTTSTTTPRSNTMTLSGFPTAMTAGETKSVTVTVENTGATAWTRAADFQLSAAPLRPDTWNFATLPQLLPLGTVVEYGQSYSFSFNITAPNPPQSPRTYTIGFTMHQSTSPFGVERTTNITVTGYNELTVPANITIAGVTERMYRMNLSAGSYIFRTLYTSANSDTILTLLNSSMAQVASNDDVYGGFPQSRFSRIEYNVPSAATYYLKITGFDNAAVTCRVTANTFSNTTLTSSEASVSNVLEGFYSFVPQTTGDYVISTKRAGSTNFDTYLFLLNSSGGVLKHDDDGGEGDYSQIKHTLTSGTTYLLRVSNNQYATKGINKNVTCKLSASLQSALPPVENQAFISITSPGNGNLVKVYNDNTIKITGTCANVSNVTVTANGQNLPGVKRYGNTFEVSYKPGSSEMCTIRATGTAAYGGTNPTSQVTVNIAVNDDGDDFDSATGISPGIFRTAAIDFAGDVDFFAFIPQKSGYYNVRTTGNTDTIIHVYDSSYNILGYNDDDRTGTVGSNADVAEYFIGGRPYYIVVHSAYEDRVGVYDLMVQSLEDDIPVSKALTLSAATEARFDYPDDEDLFIFRPGQSRDYTFRTTGNTDTIVTVYDDGDNFMTFDDNSGAGSNCQVTVYLQANRNYYFSVKHSRRYMYGQSYSVIIQ